MEIHILKANKGDCIHIRYGIMEKKNIIVDSGTKKFGKEFKNYIKKIKNNKEIVDALIITHIDDDHIGGFFDTLKEENLNEYIACVYMACVYKNDVKVYYSQDTNYSSKTAISILDWMESNNMTYIDNIRCKEKIELGEARITFLTPNINDMNKVALELQKETPSPKNYSENTFYKDIDEYKFQYSPDTSISNKASISFIFNYNNKNYAFLGDANIENVIEGLESIKFDSTIDLVKLSHHGSPKNINKEFLQKIPCNNFLLSTNSPISKSTLNLILTELGTCNIHCNYDWWTGLNYFTENDKKKYINTKKLTIVNVGENKIEL